MTFRSLGLATASPVLSQDAPAGPVRALRSAAAPTPSACCVVHLGAQVRLDSQEGRVSAQKCVLAAHGPSLDQAALVLQLSAH